MLQIVPREWLKQFVIFISHNLVGQQFEQNIDRMACPYCMMPETSAIIIRFAEDWNSWRPATYFSLSLSVCFYLYLFLHPLHVISLGFLVIWQL